MNIEELKKLIKTSTAVLVLDNGEPSFVVINYPLYKDLVAEQGGEKEVKITQTNGSPLNSYVVPEKERDILDRLNKEILALKSQIELEETKRSI